MNNNNSKFYRLAVLAFLAILLAYSNHFSNSFHFDDDHTIVNNPAIRDINVYKFFVDGKTISTLPTNQSYRPFLTLENAIDFKLSKGGGTQVFHIHIFITFIFVCILIFVFVKDLLYKIDFQGKKENWALLAATMFGLLCANAETVNYIFQRAEIDAALFVLAGMVAFTKGGFWRKYQLYLIFPLIGFFAKEMAFVFAPLLLLYLLIFEENMDLLHFYRSEEIKKLIRSLKTALPAILLTIAYFIFYKIMIPETWTTGGDNVSVYKYMITQPLVICHYIVTYFIPYNLSADTDWTVFNSIADYRAITGIVLLIGILYLALKSSKNKNTRLFSFGLLWFLISLIPTSSVLPYSEVLNDHRCFIPYIGLTIAALSGFKYLLDKYFPNALYNRSSKRIVVLIVIIFLTGNAFGVHQRNKVWHDDLSLWKDVTEKSPLNARGWMNYGVALMKNGEYEQAEMKFLKAASLNPVYAFIYINLGIVNDYMGKTELAESYFKRAIECKNFEHVSWYYYGHFLLSKERLAEAENALLNSLKIVPDYYSARVDLMQIYLKLQDWDKLKRETEMMQRDYPNDPFTMIFAELLKSKQVTK
ncbi:MAG: tetratricopeptide repeat protein [Bacteroidales bacterium]|jgi:tetratricopeptide (TPR) repeat protein|nr:tetratricopeptide repeat protein [Bacteroidales bacterium]